MIRNTHTTLSLLALLAAGGPPAGLPAWADDDGDEARYEVTVTNLTRGQSFTPILVAAHRQGVKLFELGHPASTALATLAEEGNTAPLAAMLITDPRVLDVQVGDGLLGPGQSRIITVATRGRFNRLSAAAMLIPTNDGFFVLSGIRGPESDAAAMHYSVAYDSGSERNDETCGSTPGPSFTECGGPGGGAATAGGEEGYVHVHAGMHGIGDFDEAQRDWRNPVALIRIRRVD